MANILSSFRKNENGTAAIEFAIAAPIIILFVVGIIEVTLAMAVSTMIEGGLREASRYGVTAGAQAAANRQGIITQIVNDHTYGLVDTSTINLTTKVYGSFSQIGDETYTDSNGNGHYDAGEPYVDRNGNGVRDVDGGTPGLGTANQIVVYSITYNWPYLTGLMRPLMGDYMRISSSIVVRNEPL